MKHHGSVHTVPDLKEAAQDFLRMVASGRVAEAYEEYVDLGFRHHNPHFAGDADSLKRAMEESAARNPGKTLEIQRALQDGDLVAVHARVRHRPDDPGAARVHIFRFEGDRIVEMWDIGQEVPETSPNRYGMF